MDDGILSVFSGLGHTGCIPFDDNSGWYRDLRGPTGSIRYSYRKKHWTTDLMRDEPIFRPCHNHDPSEYYVEEEANDENANENENENHNEEEADQRSPQSASNNTQVSPTAGAAAPAPTRIQKDPRDICHHVRPPTVLRDAIYAVMGSHLRQSRRYLSGNHSNNVSHNSKVDLSEDSAQESSGNSNSNSNNNSNSNAKGDIFHPIGSLPSHLVLYLLEFVVCILLVILSIFNTFFLSYYNIIFLTCFQYS